MPHMMPFPDFLLASMAGFVSGAIGGLVMLVFVDTSVERRWRERWKEDAQLRASAQNWKEAAGLRSEQGPFG